MIVYVIPDAIRYSSAFLLSTTGGGGGERWTVGWRVCVECGDGCRNQPLDDSSSQGKDLKYSLARALRSLWMFSYPEALVDSVQTDQPTRQTTTALLVEPSALGHDYWSLTGSGETKCEGTPDPILNTTKGKRLS